MCDCIKGGHRSAPHCIATLQIFFQKTPPIIWKFQKLCVYLQQTKTNLRLINMSAKHYKKLNYLMVFVKMFADKFGLTERQAFNYLDAHKGFAFVDKHYDAIHTMDFAYAIQDVQEVCQAYGGRL